MQFNNTYFPSKDEVTQIDKLFAVPAIINTYTLNSKFDGDFFENEMRQKFPNISLSLISGSNQIQVSGSGNESGQIFNFRFNGEGIQFKILFEKNTDFKSGYISLEFTNGGNHPIKNVIEKCIRNCFVSVVETLPKSEVQTVQPEIMIESSVIQKSDSAKTCNCNQVVCHSFGGQAIRVTDFTNYFIEHFRYSNYHVYGLYTCTACQKIWFLQGYYADRPPYVNSAETISVNQLKNLSYFTAETITSLMDKEGPHVLKMIVDGELIKVGDLQRKHFPKCRCAELTDESFESLTRPIEYVTDSHHTAFSHAWGACLIYVHQCKICNTGWVYYANTAPQGHMGWKVKKVTGHKIDLMRQNAAQQLSKLAEEKGVYEFVKILD